MRAIELAERIGAVCQGGEPGCAQAGIAPSADLSAGLPPEPTPGLASELTEVASFAAATPRSVVFVEQQRYLPIALASAAGCIIVPADAELPAGAQKVFLRAVNPRLAFALAAAELSRAELRPGGVAPSSVVDPSAHLDPTVSIGPLCVVGAGARLGARTRLGPGCILGPGVVLGADCELLARVVVHSGCTLGDRVVVKSGAVLGSDGFGFVPDPATGRYHKFPQIGRLEIGNDVEIGANTTIDRGALDTTVIADGVKLDNLCQVAHNVRLGRNVVVASQTGISGSSVLEDNVLVGGQVGIADHVTIEQGVILGAQCGVPSKKVVRGKGILFWGTPARPIAEYLKELATLARLARRKK